MTAENFFGVINGFRENLPLIPLHFTHMWQIEQSKEEWCRMHWTFDHHPLHENSQPNLLIVVSLSGLLVLTHGKKSGSFGLHLDASFSFG
jgi:hypothetical protein